MPESAVSDHVNAAPRSPLHRWPMRAALLSLATLIVALLVSGFAGVGTSPSVSAVPTKVFYLDVGASVSVGVQPTPAVPTGQPTNRGYSHQLVTLLARKGITLQLNELGCPGESLATMINGGDRCYKAPDTQLSDAVTFLRAHHSATTLVTVDLGFNTINPCFRKLDIDLTCVTPHVALMGRQLHQVLTQLTAAAGPHVTFVGVGHYNPFLVDRSKEGKIEVFATNSVVAIRRMNATLKATFASFSMPMADVATAFHEQDTRQVFTPKKESVPMNVVFECALTWMCAPAPMGPNIHPNNAGYEAISDAIAAVLPASL